MTNLLIVSLAIALDFMWGEWRRRHPMTGFYHWSRRIEGWFYPRPGREQRVSIASFRLRGFLAAVLIIIPIMSFFWLLSRIPQVDFVVSVLTLFWATGARAVSAQAMAVLKPMVAGNMVAARDAAACLSRRSTSDLSEGDVARITVESVLEKGNDAVFGSLFWYFVAGVPGVVLYRLSRSLASDWTCRDDRYRHFGWSITWLGEVMGWLPSRLTACTYAVLGNVRLAWRCWRQQATISRSSSAGPVMAAGAGSLGVRLGGPGLLHGEPVERPWLGSGREPQAADIRGAIFLVQQGLALWLVLYCVIEAVVYAIS